MVKSWHWTKRAKMRLISRLLWLTVGAIALLWSIGLYYNFKAGDPIMLTQTDVVVVGNDKQSDTLVIIADSALKPSLERIAKQFNHRHTHLDIQIHYTSKNQAPSSQNIARIDDDNINALPNHNDVMADLWLDYSPNSAKAANDIQAVSRFDFAILESNASPQTDESDGHTISTKPNTPPLSGAVMSDKRIALDFKNFLLSSVAQDVFVANGLQSIEPKYATKTFFTTNRVPS